MSRIPCAAFTLLALLVATSTMAQRREFNEREPDRVAEAVEGLKKDLRDARRLLVDVNDDALREKLELLLSRAALKAEDLKELVGDSRHGRDELSTSDADLAKLIDNIKDQPFDEQKLEFVKTFVKGRPLNCEQAAKLLKTFSFDDGRKSAAVIIYPGLVDSENFFEVLKIFPFDSTRKQVMEAVRKK